jgi:prepilin-type N-terminal cleavage/methylation domain-containing protein
MFRSQKGFTLIELMIVVVIIGILAAIAIPNFIAMQNRAKEGSTKANMHTLQLAAEDYGVRNDGVYSGTMSVGTAATDFQLPGNFKNPFNGLTTSGNAWEDRATFAGDPTAAVSGIVSYADSSNATYNIKGVGKVTSGAGFPLALVLSAGQ